jgi:VIT1/CCC1 family predicted Fe2+/Mn2+ transporter
MEKEVTASRPELAELATLADALVNEIAEARGRYEELAELIDNAEIGGDMPEAQRASAIEDEAHLVALAMATNGATRADAREHLISAFGIEDPEEILDQAFAATSESEAVEPARRRRFMRRSR